MASEYAAPLSPAAGGLSDLLQQHGSRDYLGAGSPSPKRRNDSTINESTTAMRTRRPAQRLGRDPTGEKGSGGSQKMKPRLSSNQMPRSLLPATERKSQDDNKGDMRRRKGSVKEKVDITPDGGSAGREGRQFAVANVGNNGRIYLRPTIRPAHQRYPQPHFVFPVTPPATATLKPLSTPSDKAGFKNKDEHKVEKTVLEVPQIFSSQWTLPPTPSTSAARRTLLAIKRGRHRRVVSDSTVPDLPSVTPDSEMDGLKIVITQPKDDQRPRSVEDRDPPGFTPILDVSIPNWKLGTPRFTYMGGADIRGSSYGAPTEIRSDSTSVAGRKQLSTADSSRGKKLSPISIPSIPRVYLSQLGAGSPPIVPISGLRLRRATYVSTYLVIEPRMFDDLTFKPACDDRSIVRYSHHTGAVTAASPPRLVAEITSPSFLDYELLSDFFLTFRSFLEPYDLLKMLVARLRWALAREDEMGMVVRVRTFVALRHWILNYFMDDFVIDYQLRTMFCDLINDFVNELCQDQQGRKVQVKILGELKKCWRRVCAQYWDSADFGSVLGAEVPIAPGGIAGHRNAELTPAFLAAKGTDTSSVGDHPPQLAPVDGIYSPLDFTPGYLGLQGDIMQTGYIDTVIRDDRPATPLQPDNFTVGHKRPQPSSLSVSSVDAMSCSFPTKNLLSVQPGAGQFLAAHPVDPSTLTSTLSRKASTPKALAGKRVRPQSPQHKRNGSLTDSLRNHSKAGEKLTYKSTEFLMTYPYVGSLVRGAMFPPGQAFVEIPTPGSGEVSRLTTVFQPHPAEAEKDKASASAMSGQGMRKLLTSVRRAISTRGQGLSPTQGSFLNISPLGPRGVTTNRLPGTAIVPQARPKHNGIRPPVRIDLLGAEVAEDFKKAVREDAAADAANLGIAIPNTISGIDEETGEDAGNPTFKVEVPSLERLDDTLLRRPLSDPAIISGSKSIVIVDDTIPPEPPHMSNALLTAHLPMVNPSVEAFADSFASAADPTPPNTPPGHMLGTPRQDSYILRHTLMRQSYSEETLPPLDSEIAAFSNLQSRSSEDTTRQSMDTTRPSADYVRQSTRRPPLSGVYGHFRQPSSKSYRSLRSFGRPRHASFTSGITPQAIIGSFDTATFPEQSVADEATTESPQQQPHRVLRRRPGGDLRGVTNVGQLDHHQLRRSRSVGSLTTFTESIPSSFIRSPTQDNSDGFVDIVDVMSDDYSQERAAGFSLGNMTQKPAKKPASVFSTYSSTPVMRPSFEAEAQKLAQIPDDPDDSGGVESALAKLEGKYEKKTFKLSMEPKKPKTKLLGTWSLKLRGGGEDECVTREKKDHRNKHIGDDTHLSQLIGHKAEEDQTGILTGNFSSNFLPAAEVPSRRDPLSTSCFSSGSSEDSLSLIPILERGQVEDSQAGEFDKRGWTNRSVLQDDDLPTPRATSDQDSVQFSYDFVEKTNSLNRIQPGDTMPRHSSPTKSNLEAQSFLFDEDDSDSDSGSDLSSEMSLDLPDDSDEMEEFGRKRSGTLTSRLPAHPLGEPNITDRDMTNIHPLKSHPPSPPMTLVQALQMSPETGIRGSSGKKEEPRKPHPPTPDITPTLTAHKRQASKQEERPDAHYDAAQQDSKFSVHLPFILAFDSQILAQQFTLIEKDALNEVDWKELIDMRWKRADNSDARSWVDFLRNTDARGVEVVIARFNIMVKWCVSEIVLTQDLEERARCLIKFIHIAAHCRRYRNFATMSQIAIAVTSPEVSKLQRTWAMVPASDLATLQQLEALVSPTRNFYNLRAEMEGGDVESATMGCIPFVGIYTHDLLFNAQRPSEIAGSPTTAPLVNFERCRCAASIIKTLLRLLEASSLYTFQPIEGITERCLWMGALSDDEIRKISEGLE